MCCAQLTSACHCTRPAAMSMSVCCTACLRAMEASGVLENASSVVLCGGTLPRNLLRLLGVTAGTWGSPRSLSAANCCSKSALISPLYLQHAQVCCCCKSAEEKSRVVLCGQTLPRNLSRLLGVTAGTWGSSSSLSAANCCNKSALISSLYLQHAQVCHCCKSAEDRSRAVLC